MQDDWITINNDLIYKFDTLNYPYDFKSNILDNLTYEFSDNNINLLELILKHFNNRYDRLYIRIYDSEQYTCFLINDLVSSWDQATVTIMKS